MTKTKTSFEIELLNPTKKKPIPKWSTMEYYLLNLGTNIGIGCIWRFSYLMFNGGGGAFLLPYLLMNLILIYPSLSLLISKGQNNSKGLLSIYQSLNPKFVGISLSKCFYSLCVSTFYVYLLVYTLKYLIKVLFFDLPWLDQPPSKSLDILNDFFNSQIINTNSKGFHFILNKKRIWIFPIGHFFLHFGLLHLFLLHYFKRN